MTAEKMGGEEQKRIFDELFKQSENNYCAECRSKGPRWASTNLGIFICIRCSGIHRNLGTHLSKVKSTNLDAWPRDMVANMQKIGNAKAAEYWEAHLPEGYDRPNENTDTHTTETFIRSKYERKLWIAKPNELHSKSAKAAKSSTHSNASSSASSSTHSTTGILAAPATSSSSARTSTAPVADLLSFDAPAPKPVQQQQQQQSSATIDLLSFNTPLPQQQQQQQQQQGFNNLFGGNGFQQQQQQQQQQPQNNSSQGFNLMDLSATQAANGGQVQKGDKNAILGLFNNNGGSQFNSINPQMNNFNNTSSVPGLMKPTAASGPNYDIDIRTGKAKTQVAAQIVAQTPEEAARLGHAQNLIQKQREMAMSVPVGASGVTTGPNYDFREQQQAARQIQTHIQKAQVGATAAGGGSSGGYVNAEFAARVSNHSTFGGNNGFNAGGYGAANGFGGVGAGGSGGFNTNFNQQQQQQQQQGFGFNTNFNQQQQQQQPNGFNLF